MIRPRTFQSKQRRVVIVFRILRFFQLFWVSIRSCKSFEFLWTSFTYILITQNALSLFHVVSQSFKNYLDLFFNTGCGAGASQTRMRSVIVVSCIWTKIEWDCLTQPLLIAMINSAWIRQQNRFVMIIFVSSIFFLDIITLFRLFYVSSRVSYLKPVGLSVNHS